MSDEETPKQVAGRAVQPTAPGVLTSVEITRNATLNTGDLVGGRFVIVRYLGSSGGGVSYLAEDTSAGGEVVLKVLAMEPPDAAEFGHMAEAVRLASTIDHPNLVKIIGMGRTEDKKAFIAMEFVKGQSLSALLSKARKAGRALSPRETFTILAHVTHALDTVHQFTHHGVLTPYNIYLDHRGVVRVGNLAWGKIAADYLHHFGEGPYVDSIYVAPEAAQSPDLMSDAADIYSLGMLAAEMLSAQGLPDDRDEAKAEAIMSLTSYPAVLGKLISTTIGEDLAARPRSAKTFREQFLKAMREMKIDVSGPAPEGDLQIEPAIKESKDDEENLFDIPELATLGETVSNPEDERFLVQKGGLDYGPFTSEQVLEQLRRDEIDEFTPVLDRVTTHRVPLGEMERFKKQVKEYIPIREERRRKEAEARAELERKVKKGGYAGLAVAVVIGLVFLVLQILYFINRPDPISLPIQEAFAEMDYKFLPPPKEFTAVAVDKELLENIFNPKASEEEIAKAIKKRQKKRGRPSSTAKKGEDGGVFEVDMSAGGSEHTLTDEEVNDVILANFGGLRSCILKELNSNPSFRGVTVQFFIRPTGTTGGVKIREGKYSGTSVGDCLTSRFRGMKFPEHGGFNRGVTYPLMVQ